MSSIKNMKCIDNIIYNYRLTSRTILLSPCLESGIRIRREVWELRGCAGELRPLERGEALICH